MSATSRHLNSIPRSALRGQPRPEYWRSLEELADTPEFESCCSASFRSQASEWLDRVDRRGFLKLMGASLALAGLSGCLSRRRRRPTRRSFRTSSSRRRSFPASRCSLRRRCRSAGFGRGVLVESHVGRPTKIEGNPDPSGEPRRHRRFTQASILVSTIRTARRF